VLWRFSLETLLMDTTLHSARTIPLRLIDASAHAYAAPRLRRISSEQAQFNNLLAQAPALHLRSVEEGTWLSLEHPVAAPAAGYSSAECLVLSARQGSLVLESGVALVQALSTIAVNTETAPARVQWLMQSALALLPQPLSALFSQLNFAADVRPGSSPMFEAQLVLRTKDHVMTAHARAPLAVWCLLFPKRPTRSIKPRQMKPWWRLHTHTRVLAGSHTLSAQALKNLACGDTILLDTAVFNTECWADQIRALDIRRHQQRRKCNESDRYAD
jgi:hypothetical protein